MKYGSVETFVLTEVTPFCWTTIMFNEMRSFFMFSFSAKFKLKVVFKYLSGIGSTTLNHFYGIKGSATIYIWVNKYMKYGYKGLVVSHTKKEYPFKYKLKVLNWMVLHHKSYPETALHFNIAFPATIFTWERKLENGDLHPMKSKHKSHTLNNLIKSLTNQLASARKHNLKLRIACRYRNLLRHNPSINSIDKLRKEFTNVSLSKILSILHLPRSSYYYHRKTTFSRHSNKIAALIHMVRLNNRNFGYRRITATLRNQGIIVNHKRVQRVIQKNHWQCTVFSKRKRKYNSYHGQVGHIAPNLLNRDFKSNNIGRKTTTDVSEFRYGNHDIHHRVYLSPFMDLATDEIIAYNISDHPTVGFTLKPLIKGLNRFKRLPYRTIVHSDQGIQYQSHQWQNTLKQYGAIQSMSRKGTCLDNAQMESFFHIMKAEMMNKHYKTEGQLVQAMKAWIHYYNYDRIKEKLDYKSPIQYRESII